MAYTVYECLDCEHCVQVHGSLGGMVCMHPDKDPEASDYYEPIGMMDAASCDGFVEGARGCFHLYLIDARDDYNVWRGWLGDREPSYALFRQYIEETDALIYTN